MQVIITVQHDEKLNVFNLLPEKFTINEVQEIYETIFEKPFLRANFQTIYFVFLKEKIMLIMYRALKDLQISRVSLKPIKKAFYQI